MAPTQLKMTDTNTTNIMTTTGHTSTPPPYLRRSKHSKDHRVKGAFGSPKTKTR